MTDTPQTNTTEHTPGPWEVDIYHGTHGNSVQIRARGKRRADVAQAYCDLSGGVTVAEQDANGHLLAAAPTMLAALKDCSDFFDKKYELWSINEFDKVFSAIKANVLAAIAKAEGE